MHGFCKVDKYAVPVMLSKWAYCAVFVVLTTVRQFCRVWTSRRFIGLWKWRQWAAVSVYFLVDPLLQGHMYFLCPRKCGIFGVCREASPQQANYHTDEGMSIGKGSNYIASFTHDFFKERYTWWGRNSPPLWQLWTSRRSIGLRKRIQEQLLVSVSLLTPLCKFPCTFCAIRSAG